jgi:lipopolysaccharide transport system permease protein
VKYRQKGECGLKNNEITDITSKRRLFELNLGDVRKYRDLVMLFVKRDFKNSYKQTVLGPLWIIIKPFLSTFVFTVIFGMIANISTDGMPKSAEESRIKGISNAHKFG